MKALSCGKGRSTEPESQVNFNSTTNEPPRDLGQNGQEASISFSFSRKWRPRLAYLTKLLRDSREIRGVAASRATKWDTNVKD